jgi:EmrB/QacA subfamily drug resistance transporter
MTTSVSRSEALPAAGGRIALLVIAAAQLMLVLDDTIANIALPSIQREFGVPPSVLPWIINAYVLAFGSLLLFGGRLGDVHGRRKVLRIGLAIFIAASMLGGVGMSPWMLILSRTAQGIGAALIAPNVLALIATNFPAGKSRNTAMAVYAAMSAVGLTVGVLLGGVLTGMLNWRWVFLINVPIGLAVLTGTKLLVEGERDAGRLSLLDSSTATAGLFALAYSITLAGERGWADFATLAILVAAGVLLAFFLTMQMHRERPMLPIALLRDRNRSGSYLTVLFIGAGLMSTYYLLALYMQQVLQFDAIKTGLASLPVSIGIILSAGVSTKMVERLSPRSVAGPGLLVAASGLAWLSQLSTESSYLTGVLPGLFVTYFGLGMGFMPMTLTAVHRVDDDQAGVASAMLNTSQQIGAALGVAIFAAVGSAKSEKLMPELATIMREGLAEDQPLALAARQVLAAGYSTAFLALSASLVLAAALMTISVTTRQTQAAKAQI